MNRICLFLDEACLMCFLEQNWAALSSGCNILVDWMDSCCPHNVKASSPQG